MPKNKSGIHPIFAMLFHLEYHTIYCDVNLFIVTGK